MSLVKRTALKDRILPNYTVGEELFNMISHIVGAAFGLVALSILVGRALWDHDFWAFSSGLVYGLMMILLYTMSSVYHGLRPGTAKKVLQILDHCSVFLLIAGTYTPFLLNGLRETNPALAWTLFGVIWGAAVLGVTLNAIDLKRYRVFSMIAYLGMGWAAVVAWRPMIMEYSMTAMILLLSGGLAYSVGALLYILGKRKRMKYMHSVFHLFCLAGTILHFLSIVNYVW